MYVPEFTTTKKEITLEDIMAGNNYYGDLMRKNYTKFQTENPDVEIDYHDFAEGLANIGAFEYTSIEDGQVRLERFVDLAALALVILTVPFPPLSLSIGALYGSYEIASAVKGSNVLTGRKLEESERWEDGIFGAMAFIPFGYISKAKWFKNLAKAGQSTRGAEKASGVVLSELDKKLIAKLEKGWRKNIKRRCY
ncbi:hypothetical protein [Listeria fleischmannii]|uniref:Pre-toxin TG domain-containing protein n=1 Tax=Listeria fleischmannii FSL S10-1203 TaxID=1265822 RepID=W7DEZ3_9LIST|nr:hypothetical protein [Listeria fleischmannii]EUJ43858.1 hypothetical protein MCOL2_20343 [Listeria fleischmannii FSL S10-1203]